MKSLVFFIELSTRRVETGGISAAANGLCMTQIARNVQPDTSNRKGWGEVTVSKLGTSALEARSGFEPLDKGFADPSNMR